jgi:nucleotide-binding universal stress UspA family protein
MVLFYWENIMLTGKVSLSIETQPGLIGSVQTTDQILVAMDGSPSALSAARVAIQIAQTHNLAIHGIYVAELAILLDGFGDYQAELGVNDTPNSQYEMLELFQRRGYTSLLKLKQMCEEASVPMTGKIVFGGVAEVVAPKAAQFKMLAIGKHGFGHSEDPFYLGRNFQGIIRQSHQPVLVGGVVTHPVRRVLLAGQDWENKSDAIKWAANLQDIIPCEERLLEDCRLIPCTGHVASEIIAAATSSQADFIIMETDMRTAETDWLDRSTVGQVLSQSSLPVLVSAN